MKRKFSLSICFGSVLNIFEMLWGYFYIYHPVEPLRELGVAGSYTMEASLGGQSSSNSHFNTRDYLSQGRCLGR